MVGPTATTTAGSVVIYAQPSASDAVDGVVPVTCSPASGSTFDLGLTTVTCTAADAAGNSCPQTFTVLVCFYGYAANANADACVPRIPSGDFCTLTQGGWGADLPTTKSCPNYNPACLLDRCYAPVFGAARVAPDSIIGDVTASQASAGAAPFYAEWTSAAAIRNFLPAGSTPAALAADETNPVTTAAGVLAGQTLALTLNLEFDATSAVSARGVSCRFPRNSNLFALSSLVYTDSSSSLDGQTVGSILDQANAFLANGNGAAAADLNAAIDRINRNFDNCNSNLGFLKVQVPAARR